jgi:hypothetical protein
MIVEKNGSFYDRWFLRFDDYYSVLQTILYTNTISSRKRLTPDFTIKLPDLITFEPNTFTQTFDTLKAKAISSMKNNPVIGAILVLQNKTRRWSRL